MEKLFQALDGHSFWGYKLFAIPMYLFLLLAFTVITANQLDIIPSSMVGSIGAMFIIGIVMGELGDRLPVWKDYIGGGTLLALLGGSLLVYFNLLGESCRESIGELMKTTDFITFYAAVLITGSILSIDRAVLLHGLLYGLQNDYIYECVAKYPDKFKGSGSFDPCIDQAEVVLNRLIHHYGYRILKFELSTGAGMTGLHPDLKVDGEEFERVYAEAKRYGVTIVFDIGSRGMKSFQVEELIRAAIRHPEVKFTLCHLMAPNGTDFEAWRQDMKRLAARENIWFDLTAVPWNIHETYPYPVSLRYVAEAVKLAGTGRLLWGSDVPTLLNMDSYGNLYQYLIDGKICTANGLDDLLYRTSEIVYGK